MLAQGDGALGGGMTSLRLLPKQTRGSKEDASEEQRPEDCLVVSGKPQRKIDVEIVSSIGSVARGHVRERAAPPIEYDNEHLDCNDSNEYERKTGSVGKDENRNRKYTRNEESPDNRVQALDDN
jgi:hypothetical protein